MNLMEWEVGIPGKANVSVLYTSILDLSEDGPVTVAMGGRRLQIGYDIPRWQAPFVRPF